MEKARGFDDAPAVGFEFRGGLVGHVRYFQSARLFGFCGHFIRRTRVVVKGMNWPFDHTTRRNIAERCAAFTRLAPSEPVPALQRAAVAFALTAADAGGGTAFLLTRRAASLRAHSS